MKQAQSYYSVILRSDFSIYEMRIMLKIVQRAQPLYVGRKYSDFLQQAICTDGINMNFAIPLSELLGANSHNTGPLKAAIKRMEKEWYVEYYDRQSRVWHSTSMIYNVRIEERSGLMRFGVAKWLIDYIADFRNGGFRVYDFENAMSLRNPNAARLYLLMAGETRTRAMAIEDIKAMLGCAGVYNRPSEFIRRVIKPAQRELEKKGYNGFNFEPVLKYAGKKKSGIVGLKISPVKRERRENISVTRERLEKELPQILVNYLAFNCGFSFSEISNNGKTLKAFVSLQGWEARLGRIVERARRGNKNHGYIIDAMKKEYAENAMK